MTRAPFRTVRLLDYKGLVSQRYYSITHIECIFLKESGCPCLTEISTRPTGKASVKDQTL